MHRFIFLIDELSQLFGKLFSWLVIVLTAVVCYEVFMRYGLNRPTTWGYDASYMLYGALFFTAGAYALAQGAHVRANVLYRLWRPRMQAGVDLVLYIIFFFPGIIALVYAGYHFAMWSFTMGERSPLSPAGLPLWPLKMLIPISGALLFLQGVAEVLRCVICLREGAWPPRLSDVHELDEEIADDPARAGAVADEADPAGFQGGERP